MLRILITGLLLLAGPAWAAQTVNISIVHPSRYSDNSTLPLSDIQGYKIYYAVDSAVNLQSQSMTVGPVDSVTINLDLAPRSAPYLVHVAAQTITAVGVSDLSSEASISKQIGHNIRPIAPIIIDIEILCDMTCRVVNEAGI
jgi:hypothetical protein